MDIRRLAVIALAAAGAAVVLAPRHRARVREKLEESRRFISHRSVDREARESRSRDRWIDDGGM